MEVSGQLHAPGRFTSRERAPGTHWVGSWVGPTAVLDAVMKKIYSYPTDTIVRPKQVIYWPNFVTGWRRCFVVSKKKKKKKILISYLGNYCMNIVTLRCVELCSLQNLLLLDLILRVAVFQRSWDEWMHVQLACISFKSGCMFLACDLLWLLGPSSWFIQD
jgi:hypothetical protein